MTLLLLLLLTLLKAGTYSSKAFRIACVSGNSPFFDPVRDGWNDVCQDLSGSGVTCEYYKDEQASLQLLNYTWPGAGQERIHTCVGIIRALVERGDVDALAVKCNLDEDDPPVIQEAYDAGIPTIVFAGPHVGPYVSYIGTNNFEVGRAMARILKQLKPEGGTYVTTYNGPSSLERSIGFEKEITSTNNRKDKPTWVVEPSLNLTALQWDLHEFRGVTWMGGSAGIPALVDIIAQSNPTALCFMYQTPLRHPNYTDIVGKLRLRNITVLGIDGNAQELNLLARGYVDGVVGQQTYDMGVLLAQTLYKILTEGVDSCEPRYLTKLIHHTLVPPELPAFEVDQSLIGDLQYVGFVGFGIIFVGVLICAIWTLINRKSKVVLASQPFFLVMTAAGVLLIASTLIPLSFDDNGKPMSDSFATGICMSVPWLGFLGFSITFSALFAKTWRVNKFFQSSNSMGRLKVQEQDALLPLLIVSSLNISVLVCWTVIDPLIYVRTFDNSTDLWNREIASNGSCRSENGVVPYLVPLGLINFAILAVACWQAYQARDVQSEFAEAKYIAMAVFSMTQGLLTGLPIAAVAKDTPETFYLILSVIISLICLVVLSLIFIPKMMMQQRYNHMSERDQRKAMMVSVRLSARMDTAGPGSGSSHFKRRSAGATPKMNNICEDDTPLGGEPVPKLDATPSKEPNGSNSDLKLQKTGGRLVKSSYIDDELVEEVVEA